ncbi:ABC transporter ATP-binding protein [Ferrovibrio sp.]|uniref:ABC transporter ATP-binding protein n=1 Tax=Ferrovibrio sp. TaxID=1917215 RepID=UPI003D295DB6
MSLLDIKSLSVSYGRIPALRDVSLSVNSGEVVALIGANGAGKTSLLKAISRLLPASGEIVLEGKSLSRAAPSDVVRAGISHVPEGRRVFREMTIDENLEMGAYSRAKEANLEREKAQIFERFPVLHERRHQMADTLSGGEQQMLAMGRAMMAKPRILLLDEPSMGLAPKLVKVIFSIIRDINKAGTTILLVEQNAAMALGVANRAYVLENGQIVMAGEAAALARDPKVSDAYLGGSMA